jgi:hypothetical protein
MRVVIHAKLAYARNHVPNLSCRRQNVERASVLLEFHDASTVAKFFLSDTEFAEQC